MMKESGTETWELLEALEARLELSPPCDDLLAIMDKAVDIYWSSIRKYPAEGIKAWDVMLEAIIQYGDRCSPPKVSLTCDMYPNWDAGSIDIDVLDPPGMFAAIESGNIPNAAAAATYLIGAMLGLIATLALGLFGIVVNPFITLVAGGFGLDALVKLYDYFFEGYWESNFPDFTYPPVPGGTYNAGQIIHFSISVNAGHRLLEPRFEGSELVSLEPDGDQLNGSIFLLEDSTITAIFDLLPWSLQTEVFTNHPAGKPGTIQPSGTTYHDPYNVVQIYASPNDGFRFDKWSRDAAALPPESPINFTITHDESLVVAHFVKTWEVNIDVISDGTVSPAGGTFDDGSEVTFTATPDTDNNSFVGWTGDVISEEESITVTIDSDKGLIATFEEVFMLTTLALPAESGSVAPAGETTYPEDTEVDIQVTPNEGFQFVDFTGDDVGIHDDGSYFVIMDADKTIAANFIPQYKLETVVRPEATGTANPAGITYYDLNEEVILTAVPNPLHTFFTWDGDLISTENPATTIMDSDKTITAVFHEPTTLTLLASPPEEGTVSPAGETEHVYGEEVEIYGIPNNSEEYYFHSWIEEERNMGTQNPRTLVMSQDRIITGSFVQFISLNIQVRDDIGGSVSPAGIMRLEKETEVTITALPLPDFLFNFWDGDYEGGRNPISITVTNDSEIYANFVPKRKLTINISGGGATVPAAGEYFYKENEEVQISAIPGKTVFAFWLDQRGDTYADNPLTITMDTDKIIKAIFTPRYSLRTAPVPLEGGSVAPAGETFYPDGAVVNISATAAENFIFAGWHGSLAGKQNPASIFMDSNKEVYASFDGLFKLATDVEGEGEISQPPESWHQAGNKIFIYAVAKDGWVLDGWGGDFDSPAVNPLEFEINEDLAIIAIFVESYELTTSVSPDYKAGSVWPSGTTEWKQGSEIWCAATASKNTIFGYWSGDIEGNIENNPTLVVLDADKSITAHFFNFYTLSIKVDPPGGGSTIPFDGMKYPPGKGITITAYPEPYWEFSHWTGVGRTTSNPISVTMDNNREVTAHFIYRGVPSGSHNTLTIEKGSDGGEVNPQRAEVEQGTEITIEITPDGDYKLETIIYVEGGEGEIEPEEPEPGDGRRRKAKVQVDQDTVVSVSFEHDWDRILFRVQMIGYDAFYSHMDCDWLLKGFADLDEIKDIGGLPGEIRTLIDSTLELLGVYYSTHCQLLHTIVMEPLPEETGGTGEIKHIFTPDLAYPILFPPEGGVGSGSGLWIEGSEFELTIVNLLENYEFNEWIIVRGGTLDGNPGEYPGKLILTDSTYIETIISKPQGAPGILFSVYPLNIDFGEIEVGNDEDAIILAMNNSEQDVEILNPILKPIQGSGFELSVEESVVRAGEREVLIAVIAFNPTVIGEAEALVELDAFGEHIIIRISGTGIEAASPSPPPPSPENKVTISPTEIDFGTVPLNTKVEHPFSISVEGAPVHITPLMLHDNRDYLAFFMIVPFRYDPLVEGNNYTGRIEYLPTWEGVLSHSATFVCRTDGNPPEVSIRLHGETTIERLLLSETSIDFGFVTIRTTSVRKISITNIGNATANLSGLKVPDKYEGYFLETQILPGETASLMITFSPTTGDDHPGEIEFTAFLGQTLTIPVDGRGKVRDPLDPGYDLYLVDPELRELVHEVDFGIMNLRDERVKKTVHIDNVGRETVEMLSWLEPVKGVNCFTHSVSKIDIHPGEHGVLNIYCEPKVSGEVMSAILFIFKRTNGMELQPQSLMLKANVVE